MCVWGGRVGSGGWHVEFTVREMESATYVIYYQQLLPNRLKIFFYSTNFTTVERRFKPELPHGNFS